MKETIKRIHEYVWARHVDGSDHYDHSIDEEEAVRILDEYYSGIGNRNSPDQVYLGILLFERAFEYPDEQAELFARARRIFNFYRKVTGEDDWSAVEDRLEDINDFFGDTGDDEEEEEAVAEPAPVPEPEPEPEPEPAAATATAVAEEEDDGDETPPEALSVTPTEELLGTKPKRDPKEAAARAAAEIASAAQDSERKEAEEHARRREAAEAFIADLEVVDGMQLIPAGTFLFGPEGREIFLDSFYIDLTPVTNEQYQRFVRETGYRPTRYALDDRLNAPAQPVVGISFGDARQYARWAGKELPTELQWEKAGRGTDGRPYPWGNDPPGASDACFGLDPVAGAPVAVGKTLRNVSPFGVQDMSGNVWEWTTAPYGKDSEFKAVRGGSYNDPPEFLALDFRLEAHPKDKCEAIGFRCVKNIHH